MNIKLPSTITARVTDYKIDTEFGYEILWVDLSLFFGDTPITTWRVEPKDVQYRDLSRFVQYEQEDEYREDVEQFVANKLQELWFPRKPS